MGADAVVEDKVIGKAFSEEPKVMYHIKVLRDELILDCSVIAFYAAVDLRATGVAKPMVDLQGAEIGIELAEEL